MLWLLGWFVSMTLLIIKEIVIFSSISGIFGSVWLGLILIYKIIINNIKALISTELLSSKIGKFSEIKVDKYSIYKKEDSLIISKKEDDVEQVFVSLKDTSKKKKEDDKKNK